MSQFTASPLGEIVLGVQYTAVPNYKTVHSMKIWVLFRDKYPKLDGAFAPNSHRQARRGAVGAREARVEHRDAHLDLPADQDLMDPVQDPVQGIAPEHAVGGFVVSEPRRHVPPGASGSQNMKYAVQRLREVLSLFGPGDRLGTQGDNSPFLSIVYSHRSRRDRFGHRGRHRPTACSLLRHYAALYPPSRFA